MSDPVSNGEPVPGVEGAAAQPVAGPPDAEAATRRVDAAIRRAVEAASRPLPEELTLTQAAAWLGVEREFVKRLIRKGELPCRKDGKRRRISGEALRRYRQQAADRA